MAESECLTCSFNRDPVAPGGRIYGDDLWVLEHAVEPIPMAGWLVLKPRRHVEAFADLTEGEAASFGPLVRSVTHALQELLNPAKIYLSMFMEAEGFAHLHVHIIPRFEDTPPECRGPRAFEYLRAANQTGVSQDSVDEACRIAEALRARLT